MSQRNTKTPSKKDTSAVQKAQGFYRAFEERFRGPRTVIKERFEVYLPFVTPLLDLHRPAKVLDLGCGRGEWLELMRETGFEVEGVDLDGGMLQACIQLDLPTIKGDAIEFLKKKEAASHSIISAFHVVEHISFEQLNELTTQAERVLKPGGLLIIETPNPENIVVATSSFYLDPTHLHPLPPELLAFIPEYHGFVRSKILRLQERAHIETSEHVQLLDVLSGVSPDYAVVAQTTASDELLTCFDTPFNQQYGVSLEGLAQHYNYNNEKKLTTRLNEMKQSILVKQHEMGDKLDAQQLEYQKSLKEMESARLQEHENAQARIRELYERLMTAQEREFETKAQRDQALTEAQQTQGRVREVESALNKIQHELHDVHQAGHHHRQLAEARQQQIDALLNSTFWRITWPMRKCMDILKRFPSLVTQLTIWLLSLPRRSARWLVVKGMAFTLKRSGLRVRVISRLRSYPSLYARLGRLARAHDLIAAQPDDTSMPNQEPAFTGNENTPLVSDLSHLTPRARRIYTELKAAIEESQKENG